MGQPAGTRTLDPGDIVFETTFVTPQEVAAVTAVLVAMAGERTSAERIDPGAGPDGWERSRRAPRFPIEPGPGQWQRTRA